MSHIFDALLKADQNDAGADGSVPASITDLLLRAERRAETEQRINRTDSTTPLLAESTTAESLLERESTGQTFADTVLKLLKDGTGTEASSPLMTALESDSAVEVPGKHDLDDPLSQFETIRTHLTAESPLVAVMDKNSPVAEAFRLLCVRLRVLRKERQLKRLLVTSSIPQEGKSFATGNLVCTIAAVTGQKVLLIEGDLRRPVQSELFQMEKRPGLREWLEGSRELRESIYYLEGPNVWLMPAGANHNNPLDLLQSRRLSSLMDRLSSWFDWVVIDSPPMLPLADTSVLSRLSDGVLLVTRRGTTEKRWLQRAMDAIEKDKLLGAIVNSSLQEQSSFYNYYYYGASPSSSTKDKG